MGSGSNFEELKASELSQVWFVRDYLQLTFEGPVHYQWSCLTWPVARIENADYRFGEDGYRDALCSFIDAEVETASEDSEHGLMIQFANGSIAQNPTMSELVGPEIAMLTWKPGMSVWRSGEGIFRHLK